MFRPSLSLVSMSPLLLPSQVLLTYRYRSESISWSTPKELLREIRVKALERQVLCRPAWDQFAIWGAGRDGRAFFRCVFFIR